MSLPVPIPSPTEIYEWYKSSRKWWADKKWKEIVKAMSLSPLDEVDIHRYVRLKKLCMHAFWRLYLADIVV